MHPEEGDLPEKYLDLLRWYQEEYAAEPRYLEPEDLLLQLAGIGESGLAEISSHHDRYLADIHKEEGQR